MSDITLVGSGASAVHFALSALRRGHTVTMLDVGYPPSPAVRQQDTFNGLKENLENPADYFLGGDFNGVTSPDSDKEYYGIPPHKEFIFRQPAAFHAEAVGFEPLFSFGRGGLAEAWTGGSYPFNDAEMADFPIRYADMEPFYGEVAGRIGVIGGDDDLLSFFPVHANLLPPLEFDQHSSLLMDVYQRKRRLFNERFRCYMGRSRVAVLSRDSGPRKACDQSGRCMWGCPSGSLYTPEITFQECLRFPHFRYQPGLLVEYFRSDARGRVIQVVARRESDGAEVEIPVEHLVLAAGTLSSSKIYLASLYKRDGRVTELPGLMDNRQILMPFINLKMVGRRYCPESYQYHQLALGLVEPQAKEYIHCQITTLKTALMHPIMQSIPLDLKTSIFLGRNLHAALGVCNLNFHDTRRPENVVSLAPIAGESPRLTIRYTPPAGEAEHIRRTMKTVARVLGKLGAVVPPGMAHIRPMGASVHYAGTVPMSREESAHTTDADCRSREFPNLYFVDGTTFPFLPAKNITFTLMANAARVAERVFGG